MFLVLVKFKDSPQKHSEVPNRMACSLRFYRFFFAPLLTDFQPARLINLKNISFHPACLAVLPI